jgi:hypothetical protein
MNETGAARDQREAEGYLKRVFQFLIDDFGYVDTGRIPVATEDVIVRGYANRHAGIQVEISGDPGSTLFGGLRKLKDGTPQPYTPDSFVSFEEIAMARELRYQSGSHTVQIRCVDFREGEWQVQCDNRRIGPVFHASDEEIEAVARLVAAECK